MSASSVELNTIAVEARPVQQSQAKPTKPQPLWNVILVDDDDHTYEYVIRMMQTLFAHPLERSFKIACEVDAAGRAICATVHKELAELKQEQVHSFGRDPLMARCAGPMSAIIEPACGGGGGDDDAGDRSAGDDR